MVCAAVGVELKSDAVDSVECIEYEVVDTVRKPSFEVVAETVADTVERVEARASTVVAEEGEFYNKPDWIVEGALETDFKYVETIGERKAVEIAHHAAYSTRRLLLRHEGKSGTRKTR